MQWITTLPLLILLLGTGTAAMAGAPAPPPPPLFVIEAVASNHSILAEALESRGWESCGGARFPSTCARRSKFKWTWSPSRFASVESSSRWLNHFADVDAAVGRKDALLASLTAAHPPAVLASLVPTTFILGPSPYAPDQTPAVRARLARRSAADLAAAADLIDASRDGGDASRDGGDASRDGDDASRDGDDAVWIVKPADGTRGVGITLHGSLAAAVDYVDASPPDAVFVVQAYVPDPLTVEGLKFDVRQFMAVTSLDPLTVWIHDDAYLRFATQPYSLDDLDARFIHLTNHQVQKESEAYGAGQDVIPHYQWPLAALWAHLQQQQQQPALSRDVLVQKIRDVAVAVAEAWGPDAHRNKAFELLGLDILISEAGDVSLLEVNVSPGLHITTPVVDAHHSSAVHGLISVLLDDHPETADLTPCASSALTPTSAALPDCAVTIGTWSLIAHEPRDPAAANPTPTPTPTPTPDP